MSATGRDAYPDSAETALRFDASAEDLSDPTEDLANEVTSELTPAQRRTPRNPARPPIGHGIAEIEPIGKMPSVAVGTVLRDRYVLERQLASGGTAMIFRAHDLRRDATTGGGPRVAVKLLHPELRSRPQNIARIQREFRQTQALPHPNIVRFHDLDCDRGTWFIVMELLTGETLGPRLRRSAPQPMPMDETIRIATATADALAFAHERCVIHGDVKPDNVFITARGAVRVLDFGVAPESPARTSDEKHSAADPVTAAATRAYASPQVLEGQRPEPRDDVFSLACVIYEMLAGRHPYGRRGSDAARDSGTIIEPPPSLTSTQWSGLAAALSWEREPRPDIRGLIQALRDDPPVKAVLPPSVVPPSAAAPVVISQQPARPWTSRWGIGAAVALAFIFGAAISRIEVSPPEPAPAALRESAVTDAAAATQGAISAAPARMLADVPASPRDPDPLPAVDAPPAPRTAPGLVAFEMQSLTVSSRASVAAIPVRHFANARRSVEVRWRVVNGSAVAGRDYGGPESGVARFAEGHTFRIIFVPITIDTGVIGDRSFTVELTDVSPGATLGMMRSVIVTIQDDA